MLLFEALRLLLYPFSSMLPFRVVFLDCLHERVHKKTWSTERRTIQIAKPFSLELRSDIHKGLTPSSLPPTICPVSLRIKRYSFSSCWTMARDGWSGGMDEEGEEVNGVPLDERWTEVTWWHRGRNRFA